MSDHKYLTAHDTRDLGVLLEVNRRLLHPRGLALELRINTDADDGHVYTLELHEGDLTTLRGMSEWMRNHLDEHYTPEDADKWRAALDALDERIADTATLPNTGVLRVRDVRHDPEGMYFDDLDAGDVAKADRFDALAIEKMPSRSRALGYFEQPLPSNEEAA